MNGFTSKMTGGLLILTGLISFLALVTLLLFFLSFLQDVASLAFMGGLNDRLNALAGISAAVLASVLHPAVRRVWPGWSLILLAGVWAGAVAILYGSWLIITGRGGVELSSYYYFFGNGWIGLWVVALNLLARRQAVWPGHLTRWGLIAGVFMLIGLLGLYGILQGWDGDDYAPLIQAAGISFLGTGILYPVWCLRLGGWIVSNQASSSISLGGSAHE